MLSSTLGGVIIMCLIAWGISKYDGYVDELLVYQSLAIGLIGGLAISGTYLLFTRIKPAQYYPPTIDYTAPLQSKRRPISYTEMPAYTSAKSTLKSVLYYIGYCSVFLIMGTSMGFLAGVIYMLATISEIFNDAINQYSILVFVLLPLQLIAALLTSMTIGGITGAIIGFILKFFRKQ